MDATTTITSPSSPATVILTSQPRTCRDSADLLQDAVNDARVLQADEILMQERWTWVQELVEDVCDAQTRQEAKVFFLQLAHASTFEAMEVVMGGLDAWRTGLEATAVGNSKRLRPPRELKKLMQTLFLLGADKQLDLSRAAANHPSTTEP